MSSQVESTSEVTRTDGGSITTVLSRTIALNPNSSLRREWVAVHERSMPANVMGTPGIETSYKAGDSYKAGGYQYESKFGITVREDLSAFEVRFLLFDVWGRHTQTLSAMQIVDLRVGEHKNEAQWNLFSENECMAFYASIAFVARVRTKAGRVVEADNSVVLEEARKFTEKFTAEDLEESKRK